MKRKLTAVVTYSSSNINDTFQKHFHNSLMRKFLDPEWLMEQIGEHDPYSPCYEFVENIEGTVLEIGKGRTEIIYSYECNNHDAHEDFKYFFEDDIELHKERFIWWLGNWDAYMVDMGYDKIEECDIEKIQNSSLQYSYTIQEN